MSTAENLVLEHLRLIRSDLAGIKLDIRELQTRMGNVETELAHVHRVVAEQSVRIDRLVGRVERIETRFDLVGS